MDVMDTAPISFPILHRQVYLQLQAYRFPVLPRSVVLQRDS